MWGACFGRDPFVVVPWFALAPLLAVIAQAGGARRAAQLGFVHGTVSWLVSIPWIAPTLTTYGQMAPWLAALLLVVLAASLALFQALFALIAARLWRGGRWATLFGLPALWVSIEALGVVFFRGFPWNPASHAWIGLPGALPLSAWIGGYGVSFLLVLANTGVAIGVVDRRILPAALGLALPILALGAGARWGAGTPEWSGPPVAARLLQPNIQNLVEPDTAAVWANYRRVVAMARRACDQPGALLVWPESAAWPFVFERDAQLRSDVEALAALGCPVLLNSARFEDGKVFNAAYLAGGEGPDSFAAADKRHLVPFGEYVPLRRLLPFVGTLARNAGDFSPATEMRLLPWRDERLGPAICFEVIFPAETAALVEGGATILVTLTNDAWYGDTAAPWQHLRAAQFRAAENRRPLLRAAITGVSAFIEPDGAIRASLGPGEEGVLAGAVRGRRDRSPYSRAPWAPVAVSAVTLLVAFVVVGKSGWGGRTRKPYSAD